MNNLKTVANQVETFGAFLDAKQEIDKEGKTYIVETYKIDTVTKAEIKRDLNCKPKVVTFRYGVNK